ncbi:MAG TPA: hypothetical protein VLJ60_08775 [bacterium]|nr:hypothetical protein [bacterium]
MIKKIIIFSLFVAVFTFSLNAEDLKRNSLGFEFGVIDSFWHIHTGDNHMEVITISSIDLKLYYDFFVWKYFSIGPEISYFQTYEKGALKGYFIQFYSTRIDLRLKGVVPLIHDKMELFLLIRGGALISNSEGFGVSTKGFNVFGGLGFNYEIVKSLRIGALNDTGYEQFTFNKPKDLGLHFIRFTIFIEYRL